jgi:hypothetical protein
MNVARAMVMGAVLSLLLGCGQASTAMNSGAREVPGPAGFPAAKSVSRLQKSQVFGDGIRFDVPPVRQSPTVTGQQAYATCAKDAVCSRERAPTIELSTVTIPGVTSDKEARPIDNRLAYVLTWMGKGCAPAGPTRKTGPFTCTLYAIVDAASGRNLYGFEISDPVR